MIMKEYNETEAIALMSAVLPEELRDDDAVCEVLDLIYDYYEDNGDLDLDLEGDDEADINGMTAYISRFLRKTPCGAVLRRAHRRHDCR